MKLKVLATLLCLIMSSSLCAAPIEKWVDENGKTHYGVRAPDNAASTTVSRTTTITSSKLENVVLYSTSWCGYCKKARSYMRRNGIAFVDYDIEENASAKFNYDQMGGRGVPFIVKGDRVLRGFSVKRYRQFFKN